jgi:hypothetical protein
MQEEDVIASVSAIDKWAEAVKKVKAGRADVDDGDFPAKILKRADAGNGSGNVDKKALIDK